MKRFLNSRGGLSPLTYLLLSLSLLACVLLCVCAGSVSIPLDELLRSIFSDTDTANKAIIVGIRLPRVLRAGLVGASLSLCGASVQGLLRNPLADGSTLGVSSGASLGAVLALALGLTLPSLPFSATTVAAVLFAFLSLAAILLLSGKIDYSFSTNTIILVGIVFTMFANSIISLIIAFAGEKIRTITFWTMGSLAYGSDGELPLLLCALGVCGALLFCRAKELDALCIGEDNARHIGVDVKRVKLEIMASVSVLTGVCVSVGGAIGFVGLIVPHLVRMLTGPAHRRLLPASAFAGGGFLMLADLASRTVLRPIELPVGVVTSFVGAIVFVFIFYKTRRVKRSCSK